VGAIAAQVLRGARPADIPIEQPTRFELALSLKAARALGVSVPQSLRLRADEVIG
jgi:putative ABC transport system substrate-binding protein